MIETPYLRQIHFTMNPFVARVEFHPAPTELSRKKASLVCTRSHFLEPQGMHAVHYVRVLWAGISVYTTAGVRFCAYCLLWCVVCVRGRWTGRFQMTNLNVGDCLKSRLLYCAEQENWLRDFDLYTLASFNLSDGTYSGI